MEYVAAIGLEVHVQLSTRSKMFCGCATAFGAPPNTQVCPVCLGYPGALPVMNERAIRLTVRTGLMLGSQISRYSKFDRKSYFYPDMPKNYQISQYDQPLCEGGSVEFEANGATRRVRIARIHIEEDVAKNVHFQNASGVDFNRAGVPLMEIVSEPEMCTPEEAFEYLLALKRILLYAEVSECNLERGNVRCDVNVSLRPADRVALGTKTEVKNLNTFRGVLNALRYEIGRQERELAAGGCVAQETRRWNVDAGITEPMRGKEDAHDYRYFPEPDLMPVVLSPDQVEAWRAELPERPRARRERLVREFGIPDYDAGVLAADRRIADYFERAARRSDNPKAVGHWIMTEMLRLLSERDIEITAVAMSPESLAELIRLTDANVVNRATARDVFLQMCERGGDPAAIIRRDGLAQTSDREALTAMVEQAMAENPRSVADFRKGKSQAAKFLLGQVMRLSRGKANPHVAQTVLEERLAAGAPPPNPVSGAT